MNAGQATAAVSIVIPTHNRRRQLPELLAAVLPEPAAEVIVVANASSDGSLELLESEARNDPRLRPLAVEQPGQTLALEAGIEAAGGDVVLMLDDDVLPEPGLVAGHARHHTEGAGLVVVGYMPVAQPRRRRRGEFARDLYSRDYERACDEYEREAEAVLRGLWMGNVSIRREDCLRIGVRSRDMPDGYGYHEDQDLGLRCAAAGLRGVFDRRLRARHAYDKSPAAFLRASHNSGATRVAVHAAHAAALGPLSPDSFAQTVPMPGRLLVRWARGPARRPIEAMLRTFASAAGTLRIFRVESHLGYVMSKIEQQRGAREAREERP